MNKFIICKKYTRKIGDLDTTVNCWNRSITYINKIKRIQDKMLRKVLPVGEKYIKKDGENENG